MLLLLFLPVALCAQISFATLPILNLPYAKYQASYDAQNDIYLFSNIRFAAPPLGNLRWAAPQPPSVQSGIQDGRVGGSCSQPNRQSVTEDCLFLDVYVPAAALETKVPFPVLFWIYGGGYVMGSKDDYNGTSVIKASGNSIVYVQTNYRLGAFGFLASSLLQSMGGVANVGLLDQDAALNWTKQYINLLGGDPHNITVMGESAGAGSILHHITAKGGQYKPVFKRAIPQSPAFLPQYNPSQLASQFTNFSVAANCGSLACLRSQSTEVLQEANIKEIVKAPYGQYQFGPAIDGVYVQDLPGRELLRGRFAPVQLMLGHNSDEGFVFTDPGISTDAQFRTWVSHTFPYATAAVKSLITDQYYPPPDLSDGRYATEFGRLNSLISDAVISCNVQYLSWAMNNLTYNYEWGAFPGFHGLDLCYTFHPFNVPVDGQNVCLLYGSERPTQFQKYLVSFVKYGSPNYPQTPPIVPFPIFGKAKDIVEITLIEDFYVTQDNKLPEDRCKFWQSAPYIG